MKHKKEHASETLLFLFAGPSAATSFGPAWDVVECAVSLLWNKIGFGEAPTVSIFVMIFV